MIERDRVPRPSSPEDREIYQPELTANGMGYVGWLVLAAFAALVLMAIFGMF